MQIDLRDKKIIVTGASSGIGFEIARSLIESGATVAIHYNSNETRAKQLLKSGNSSRLFKADLSLEAEVIASFGNVDLIVHNAGIFQEHTINQPSKDWIKIWHTTMNTNLHAVAIMTQLGLNHFKKNQGGRMIYIASRAAFRGETEDYLAYAASKGAVVSLARSVARSFGQYGIKSFILAPGFTKTPMAADFIATNGEESLINESSLKEITQPEHISPIVTLIAAGLMDHATGSTIDFNAGSYIH